MLVKEQATTVPLEVVISELRERTLAAGGSFMVSPPATLAPLPKGQNYYEQPGDRFSVEELTFSASSEWAEASYGTKLVRLATKEEVTAIKESNSYLYA